MVDIQQNEIRDILMMQNIFFLFVTAAEMIILIHITVFSFFFIRKLPNFISLALHADERFPFVIASSRQIN